ncbi:MAG: hypothetical protein V4702_03535 [Patescibacteria group bacterium]
MNDKIDWRYMLHDTRAQVYLLWAVLLATGFTATHYYQNVNINGVWTTLSLIGLGFMYKTMPLKVNTMKRIFKVWLGVVVVGIMVSGFVAHSTSPNIGHYTQFLGGFWLCMMAIGYALNGIVDEPATWYWIAAAVNIAAGAACFFLNDFQTVQYLVAAIIAAWSMLNLWLFRVF